MALPCLSTRCTLSPANAPRPRAGTACPSLGHLATPRRRVNISTRRMRCTASLGGPVLDTAVAAAQSSAVVADLSTTLFALGQQADQLVNSSLSDVTPVTYLIVLGAGLLTSLSPCTLSVLPLTIGYIGGTSGGSGSGGSRAPEAAAFAGGLATTLALLGVVASLAGKAYGQVGGDGLPILVSLVAIAMGLNLLEVVTLPLPSFFTDVDVRQSGGLSSAAKAYLAGLTFALAASPCSTPVLASLLGYVASTGDPLRGGTLLLAYTSGYVAPLLVAASATDALTRVMALRQYSAWVTPASGALLVAGGCYSLLSRIA